MCFSLVIVYSVKYVVTNMLFSCVLIIPSSYMFYVYTLSIYVLFMTFVYPFHFALCMYPLNFKFLFWLSHNDHSRLSKKGVVSKIADAFPHPISHLLDYASCSHCHSTMYFGFEINFILSYLKYTLITGYLQFLPDNTE